MEIKDTRKGKTFREVTIGDVVEYDGGYFLAVPYCDMQVGTLIEVHSEVNAYNLETNDFVWIPEGETVTPLKATLIIGEEA